VYLQLRCWRVGLGAIGTVTHARGGRCPTLIVSGAAAPERLAQLRASGLEWLTKPVAAARLRSWLIQAGRAAFLADEAKGPASTSAAGRSDEAELKWTS